jgi:outer membrane protein assembly factor BamB
LCGVPREVWGDDWPQFRGLHGDGVVRDSGFPEQWEENSNVQWKVACPGRGWSQPIAVRDRVFLTTAVCEAEEMPRIADAPIVPNAADSRKHSYEWKLLCLDADTGDVVWDQTVYAGKPRTRKHRSNTFASETPATDGELVIAHFGNTGISCYNFDGTRLWTKDLGAYRMQADWGTGSSPVIQGDLVYVQCDNEESSFLVALEKSTGNEVWRAERSEVSNWSTPYVWKNKIRTELVTAGGTKTRSYDPTTGQLLWQIDGSGRTSATPVASDELLYLDSVDRIQGKPGHLAAIRPGAAGDVSLMPDEKSGRSVAWSVSLNAYRSSSPLLYSDCLYVFEQYGGIVHCYDALTGALHYRQRLPEGGGSIASPWASRGKIYCLDDYGRTTVLESGPTFKLVATNHLDEGMFWASPAIAGNRLLLRSLQHLYCIGK